MHWTLGEVRPGEDSRPLPLHGREFRGEWRTGGYGGQGCHRAQQGPDPAHRLIGQPIEDARHGAEPLATGKPLEQISTGLRARQIESNDQSRAQQAGQPRRQLAQLGRPSVGGDHKRSPVRPISPIDQTGKAAQSEQPGAAHLRQSAGRSRHTPGENRWILRPEC